MSSSTTPKASGRWPGWAATRSTRTARWARPAIYDGELLMIREVGRPVESAAVRRRRRRPRGEQSAVRAWLAASAAALTCFGVALGRHGHAGRRRCRAGPVIRWCPPRCSHSGCSAWCSPARWPIGPRSAPRSAWVAAVALPLLFAGSLYVVPDGFGATSLPMAFALTALSSLLVLLISGAGRALHTGVIAACVFGGASATAMLLWQPPLRTVGAVLATVSVIVVYLAPRVTILLSKLPIPRVPTAGEPLDDIETQGGTTVEGVNAVGKQVIPTEEGLIRTGPAGQRVSDRNPGCRRARRGRRLLSGRRRQQRILLAGNGFRRGGGNGAVSARAQPPRSGAVGHPDRQRPGDRDCRHRQDGGQSSTDWQIRAMVALVALMVARRRLWAWSPRGVEFSPVMRRRVEILEYIAIASGVPVVLLDHPALRVLPRTADLSDFSLRRPRLVDAVRVGGHAVVGDQRRLLRQLGPGGSSDSTGHGADCGASAARRQP